MSTRHHCLPLSYRTLPSRTSMILGLLVVAAVLLATRGGGADERSRSGRGVVERTEVADVDVVLRRPTVVPKGILMALHGCSHGAYDWATATECEGCIGLPEELSIAMDAVQRDLIVVSPSSADRMSKCWNPEVDGPRLGKVAAHLRQLHPNLPLFSFGASSGGAMAFLLPQFVKSVASVAVQIMALPTSYLENLVDTVGASTFPPTLFLHMERDLRSTAAIAANKQSLTARGIPTRSITLKPSRVTPGYLTGKLGISPKVAEQIILKLTSAKFLSAAGDIVEDPRGTAWRDALHDLDYLRQDSLVADASPLSEVLNVAWAKHEIFADTNEAMFKWFSKTHTQKNAE
eukprot:m.433631 g.433631  ORF g.433631 m.433631 type:complete len:347 (+) comp17598_c0_seq1:148-1188(+)